MRVRSPLGAGARPTGRRNGVIELGLHTASAHLWEGSLELVRALAPEESGLGFRLRRIG